MTRPTYAPCDHDDLILDDPLDPLELSTSLMLVASPPPLAALPSRLAGPTLPPLLGEDEDVEEEAGITVEPAEVPPASPAREVGMTMVPMAVGEDDDTLMGELASPEPPTVAATPPAPASVAPAPPRRSNHRLTLAIGCAAAMMLMLIVGGLSIAGVTVVGSAAAITLMADSAS